jgi:serine/threonine-protein kinase RsbW
VTVEGQLDATGTVVLSVPADPSYVSMLRTVVASLAARRDFTLDEIDDLRIAVDEAGALLLGQASPGSQLSATFDGSPASLRVEVCVTVPPGTSAEPDQRSFGWLVLVALTDSVALAAADQRLSLTLTKRRGARDR